MRLLTVEDLVIIAQQLSPAEVKEQLLKQMRQSVTDKAWRVRYMAASHFNAVGCLATVLLVLLDMSHSVIRSRWSGASEGGTCQSLRAIIEGQ